MNKTRVKDFVIGVVLSLATIGLIGVSHAAFISWFQAYNNWIVPTNNVPIAQTLSNPPLVSAIASTTSGSLVTSSSLSAVPTWYFEVEAVGAQGGETIPSGELSATLSTSTNASSSVALTWGAPQGAVSYKVFYATSSGAEATYQTTTASTYTFSTTTGSKATPVTVGTAFVNILNPLGTNYLGGAVSVLGNVTAKSNLVADSSGTAVILQGVGTSTCYALTLTSTGTIKTAATTCL